MGWLNENGHEGFVVGVDPDDRHRELGLADSERRIEHVHHVRVGCDCGWRSETLVAPLGTTWMPCTVVFHPLDEVSVDEIAHDIWVREHLAHVGPRSTFAVIDGLRIRPIGARS